MSGDSHQIRAKSSKIGNIVFGTAGEIIGKAAAFIAPIIYATILSTAEFSNFIYIFSLASIGWMFIDLGMGLFGTRDIARGGDANDTVFYILSLRILMAMVVSTILFIVGEIRGAGIQLLTFFSLYLLFRSLSLDWFFKGRKQFKILFYYNVIQSSVFVVTIALLIAGIVDNSYAGLPWVFSSCCGAVFLVFVVQDGGEKLLIKKWYNKFEIDFSRYVEIVKTSCVFTLSNGLSTLAYSFPILALGFIGSDSEVAEFGLAYRILLAVLFLYSLPPMVLFSYFSSSFDKESSSDNLVIINRIFWGYFLSGLVLVAFVYVYFQTFTTEIESVFSGYSGMYNILVSLVPFTILRASRTILVRFCNAVGGERYYMRISFFSFGFVIFASSMVFAYAYSYYVYLVGLVFILSELFLSVRLFLFAKNYDPVH